MNTFWKSSPRLCLLALLWFLFLQASSYSAQQSSLPTISAAPASVIIPPPPDYHYPDGQTYVYNVEWHMINAGTASVKLQADSGGQHVIATAGSAGVVNALYRVNDHMDAFFDGRSFCSKRISKHIEEGSKSRESDLRFDYPRGKSVLDEKNLKTGEQKHLENDIPGCVTDVASGFYYVASLPLQTGNAYIFTVSDGKTNQISVHVEAREQVKVPAGTYQTVRLRAEAISGTLKEKGVVWAWFTDDANHTPVQMRSKLGWGTLYFRLQRVEK
jgi:Protein of unknown function (DUF3108)